MDSRQGIDPREGDNDDFPLDEVRELLEESGRKKDNPLLALGAALSIAQAENARLRDLGDEMAKQIEERWSGPAGCDCAVCSAAVAWRAASR